LVLPFDSADSRVLDAAFIPLFGCFRVFWLFFGRLAIAGARGAPALSESTALPFSYLLAAFSIVQKIVADGFLQAGLSLSSRA